MKAAKTLHEEWIEWVLKIYTLLEKAGEPEFVTKEELMNYIKHLRSEFEQELAVRNAQDLIDEKK